MALVIGDGGRDVCKQFLDVLGLMWKGEERSECDNFSAFVLLFVCINNIDNTAKWWSTGVEHTVQHGNGTGSWMDERRGGDIEVKSGDVDT